MSVRGAHTAGRDAFEAIAPGVKVFTITRADQVFYVRASGRDNIRAMLGSSDGKAITLATVNIDVDISLTPTMVGKTNAGDSIPIASAATDWVDTGADLAALGTIIDIVGPASLVRFTVTALTGFTSGNLQLWVL